MKSAALCALSVALCVILGRVAGAQKSDSELIAEAERAAPKSISQNATIKTQDGKVLRKGSNTWTCYPGSAVIGPMCNQAPWDEMIAALGKKAPIKVKEMSVSYMLMGDRDAVGVSNTDPFATKPIHEHDWVKEGPHLMILVPDPALLETLSTNPEDPVYVMWKGTPYAHIMVKVGEEK